MKIMLVDDEESARRGFEKVSNQRGDINPLSFDGVDSAAIYLHKNGGGVDVAIVDILMPGKNGTDLFPVLKKYGVRAIAYTCSPREIDGCRVVEKGHPCLPDLLDMLVAEYGLRRNARAIELLKTSVMELCS